MNNFYLNLEYNTLLLLKPSKAIRLLLMVLFFVLMPKVSFGQCSFPAGATSVGTYTFCIDNTNTITTANVPAGRFVLVNVVRGYTYTFSVGNVWTATVNADRENLTLFDASNDANFGASGYNMGQSGTSINWTSTISGQIKVLLSRNCGTATSGGALTLTLNTQVNNIDSQTAFGTNTWIGHIYNSATGAAPEPFMANYAGYYTINSETINENFGGNTACFPVLSNGTQRASIYTEQFAVQYRMRSTKAAGYYFMSANADDGIRITIDGVTALTDWASHANKQYCNNLVYLDGSSDIILDYYEDGGENVVGFNLAPVSGNTISSYADRNVCSGISPGNLDGSNINVCATGTGTTNTTYQWQISTDNINFTNIAVGATSEDYTPPTVTTAVEHIRYYRRVLKALNVPISPSNPATPSVKVTTQAATVGAVSVDQVICSGSSPANITIASATGTIQWQRADNAAFTAGLTNLGLNSSTLTSAQIGVLTSTKYFRAIVSICSNSVTSTTVTVAVNPLLSNNNLTYTNGTSSQVSVTVAENGSAVLNALAGTYFASVNFASYGTPTGTSPNFVINPSCHSATSQSVAEENLLGNSTGTIPGTNGTFGDPCPNTFKRLSVVATYVEPICSGSSVSITGSLPTGGSGTYNYLWERSTTSATTGFAAAAGTNNTISYSLGAITQDTWFRRTVTSGGCSSTSTVVLIKVSPATVGGTVTGGTTICSGSTSGLLTLAGNTGTITKWQSSVSPFATWTDISNTATTYTSGALTATTQFRAEVKSGSCVTNSSFTTITVNAIPTITPNKVNETCPSSNNGSISPTISGGLANIRYIKLTQKFVNAEAWQQVQEIQAFEIFSGTNVALASNGATATSSSVYNNNPASYGEQLAIDGDYLSNNNYGFWHSNSTSINEWIKVDLQSVKNIDKLRIYNRNDCCWSRGQNMLLELFDGSDNLVYSKTVNLWGNVNGPNYIDVNVLDVSWADLATTLNRTALDSGAYTLNYADALGCSVSSPIVIGSTNAAPFITVGTPIQPNCKTPTGTVTVTAPSPATGITYTITGTNPVVVAVTNGTGVFSGLAAGNYNVTTANGSCTSSPVAVVINPFVLVTNTWNGTVWSTGLPPTPEQKIVFAGQYPQSPLSLDPDITACSCEVNAGITVNINIGRTLTLTNELKVLGTILFKDKSSLVQINDVANIGNINYERKINNSIRSSDYTYWSSPVAGFTLGDIYLGNTSGLFYSYGVNAGTEDWQQESSAKVMNLGKGYIINGAQAGGPFNPPLSPTFKGVPNNGTITFSIGFTGATTEGTSNLLGNPYPSAIDADKFLTSNADVLDGTLYFWTHNTALGLAGNIINPGLGWAYTYSLNDYASYNLTGGVGIQNAKGGVSAPSDSGYPVFPSVVDLGEKPSGKIASGQGFFATSKKAGNVTFTNLMRVAGDGTSANNSQFFKTKNPNAKTANTTEKNRVWLNLTNTEGAFKQTLIGYVTDATNDYENLFDGQSFDGNEYVDFYSVYQDKNLVIQGRALPFDENDEVPLGYRTTINGDFTINIDQVDGSLTNQAVFIEDKLTNTTFDLKTGNYTFNTLAGTFNDRFVLKYLDTSKTLTVDTVEKEDGILVFYSNNYNTLIVHNESMDSIVNSVSLFNMAGQNIGVWDVRDSEQTNIQIPIKKISSGIYIVKANTTKGESSKKIIVNIQ